MTEPKLLSGGNPQIPKGDGDASVQAYIEAMPEWKHSIGAQLDGLVHEAVPDVLKAVRWNSPFYGTEDHGWFFSFHCFTKYVKVTFLNGSRLVPPPSLSAKDPDARFVHIDESGIEDPDQLLDWIRQASELPAWKGF